MEAVVKANEPGGTCSFYLLQKELPRRTKSTTNEWPCHVRLTGTSSRYSIKKIGKIDRRYWSFGKDLLGSRFLEPREKRSSKNKREDQKEEQESTADSIR